MQHIVFTVKFLISAFIPDVPGDIKLAIKRVRFYAVNYFIDKTNGDKPAQTNLRKEYYNPVVNLHA